MIAVRKAEARDIDTIAAFQVAMAQETEALALDPPTVRAGVGHVIARPALGFYLVADVDDALAASMLVLSEWSDWRSREVWWLHSVYVVPEQRNQSLFRVLFEHARELADTQRIAGLRLYVDKRNVAAQAVYRALGMSNEHYELFELML